jgi:hypothetical protein
MVPVAVEGVVLNNGAVDRSALGQRGAVDTVRGDSGSCAGLRASAADFVPGNPFVLTASALALVEPAAGAEGLATRGVSFADGRPGASESGGARRSVQDTPSGIAFEVASEIGCSHAGDVDAPVDGWLWSWPRAFLVVGDCRYGPSVWRSSAAAGRRGC